MKGLLSFWAPALLLIGVATGCEDLGPCDEAKARELVITGDGKMLYAGQAIMNASCANGQCHTSTATGKARVGAPFGLDFELKPTSQVAAGSGGGGGADGGVASDEPSTVSSGELTLSTDALALLRKNQRKVFDERDSIWKQVDKGLMPPNGVGEPARNISAGELADPDKPCAVMGKLDPIKSSEGKETFRNWLACGSPIVEASDPVIATTTLKPKDGEPVGVPGTLGQQMPACEGSCDDPLTFDDLYASVFEPSCIACHAPGGLEPEFDVSTIDAAWAALKPNTALAGADDCNEASARAVVPGKPEDSYIIAKMAGMSNLSLCGETMPYLTEPLDCATRKVAAWITAGAPGPGEALP